MRERNTARPEPRRASCGIGQPSPWTCPAPDGRSFLVAWSSHLDEEDSKLGLEREGPPWDSGAAATPWAIGGRVFGLDLSPSGRYLAVAHAAGNWKASLWDLEKNQHLVADAPQVRAVSCVGFLPDESAMFSVSSHGEHGRLILTSIPRGTDRVFELRHARLAVAHPSGEWLVVADHINRLVILQLATGRIERTHAVGGRYPASALEEPLNLVASTVTQELMTQTMRPRASTKAIKAAADSLDHQKLVQGDPGELDKLVELMAQHGLLPESKSIAEIRATLEERIHTIRTGYAQTLRANQDMRERGVEQVLRVRFNGRGDHLLLASGAGIRVYPWERLLAGNGDQIASSGGVAAGTVLVQSDRWTKTMPAYTYDLELDPDRDRVLFAGLEGCVRYLDLSSGDSGVLVEPPGRPPIHRLALSRDGSRRWP